MGLWPKPDENHLKVKANLLTFGLRTIKSKNRPMGVP